MESTMEPAMNSSELKREIESLLKDYWQKEYQAYLEKRDSKTEESFFGESATILSSAEESSAPENVRNAAEYYNEACDDWGSASIHQLQSSKNGTCFIVSVTTDGDDGWLEVFSEQGEPLAAARRYIELLSWGQTDEIRAYAENGEFPADLNDRMNSTLWGKKPRS